jgi:hypothetical protein
MDSRTNRRHRRIALASKLAARLNAPQLGRQARAIRRLADEKPRAEYEPNGKGGMVPSGYTRSVLTTLRSYGRATLWWHAKTRTFRVKVDRTVKGHSERRLLLDAFAKVSGMVARCAAGACGTYFGKSDPRQQFCSTKCADRERQRRTRTRRRAAHPQARVAFAESEARMAGERQRRADWRVAQPYVEEQVAAARDAQARREQRRLRNES